MRKHILIFFLLCIGMGFSVSALALQHEAFENCPQIADDAGRLACFDRYSLEEAGSTGVAGSSVVNAGANEPAIACAIEAEVDACSERANLLPRLTSDDPNIFSYAQPTGDENYGDERHLEFNISIKYPFFESHLAGLQDTRSSRQQAWIPDRLYAVYNGRYDFYTLSGDERYKSSPIISREQNPGAALEWDLNGPYNQRLRVSGFHQSNGQTLDTLEELEAELEKGNGLDFVSAQVSRSWNYAQVRYQIAHDAGEKPHQDWWQVQAEARAYFFTDDEIYWDPSNDSRIEDYDGFRFMGEYAFDIGDESYILGRAEIRTGSSSLKAMGNFTGKWSLGIEWDNLMLTGFYFDGYGKEPSSYHARTQYWGVGLELR